MTFHAEDALRCSCIAKILDLLLTITAFEAGRAECLIAREDGQVFDLVAAVAAAVGAIVADEGTITQEQ